MRITDMKKTSAATALASLILLGSAGTALAQSAYPSASDIRSGAGAYGQFDLNPNESQTIVDVDESAAYRVCIVGKSSTVIVDDTKKNGLDHGDCYDVQGKKIVIQSDEGAGDTHGVYERMSPNNRINR